ncbi:MAG: HD domain-containing protein [Methanobacterium sp.]|nr:HD domain-containing protein [Methanobacterium sp.]
MPKEEKDFIKNLNVTRPVKTKFAVSDKLLKTSASGNQYLDVTLTDKTGQFDGRIFQDVEEHYNKIKVGSICLIKGRINEFPSGSGRFNMVINTIIELDEADYQKEDFVRVSDNDVKESLELIISTINDMENQDLKNLLNSFFSDEDFVEQFSRAPAAIVHHHNYEGGLLDHTVEVLRLCKTTTELFPDLDWELLCTGVLLHDLGKMKTYTYGNGIIGYSHEGNMLDHIYLSCEMVQEKLNSLETPRELALKILHMILSHHGDVSLGWGSSVNPKTSEALALHYADNLDAKVKKSLNS